jgi:hypothetical protein
MPLRSGVLLVASLGFSACGPPICVRSCERSVTLTVAGSSDLTEVKLTDAACPTLGSVALKGRVATFEVPNACSTFLVEVKTANGGRFAGQLTPAFKQLPPSACGCSATADVEVAVAIP